MQNLIPTVHSCFPHTLPRSSEAPQARRLRLNNELVNAAKHIGRVGPRINHVARLSSQHKESLRYRYHQYFLNRGITIQATPNFSKLGFTRLVIFARLAPRFESRAVAIFTILSELCYLRGFTRSIPSQEYTIHVAVPTQLKEECASAFMKFRNSGLFTDCKVLEFAEIRNPPMKADLYNFTSEAWDFQWPKSAGVWPAFAEAKREQVEKYDRFDLLILKELEIDANRNLVQMADRVDVPFRTLQFHYNHVEGRNLVRDYRVMWPASSYDFEHDKIVFKKNRYFEVTVLLEGGSKWENTELRALLNRIPFLWSEAVEPNYWAELFIPYLSYMDFLHYLEDFAGRVGKKFKVSLMDQERALRYTIPYNLFDAKIRCWRLDLENVNGWLENLLSNDPETQPKSRD
jgi:hypothetical protein